MPFLTDARCKKRYTDVTSKSQVCAGEVGQNKDTCQVIISLLNKNFLNHLIQNFLLFYKGDSGGPLVVKSNIKFLYLKIK